LPLPLLQKFLIYSFSSVVYFSDQNPSYIETIHIHRWEIFTGSMDIQNIPHLQSIFRQQISNRFFLLIDQLFLKIDLDNPIQSLPFDVPQFIELQRRIASGQYE